MAGIELGQPVKKFTVTTTGDQKITLTDLKGQNVVIYFYPKDSTPGCTTKGQDFSSRYEQFKSLNTIIFGVSRDSIKSHENFKQKQSFPFDLISDLDEMLCRIFDVIKLKKMYGREYMGIERSTFLLDCNGNLVNEWRKIKIKGHVDDVLESVKAL